MRSWILRHRLRLRLIYGPLAGELPVDGPTASGGPGLGTVPGEVCPHGRLRRGEDGLELVPMPTRVGRSRRVG